MERKCIEYMNDNWECKSRKFPDFHERDSFSVEAFREQIGTIFDQYKFKQIDTRAGLKLHQSQKFIPRYASDFNQSSNGIPIGNLLVYHNMGSGKTLTSILVGEAYRAFHNYNHNPIILVTSKSIIQGFKDEFAKPFWQVEINLGEAHRYYELDPVGHEETQEIKSKRGARRLSTLTRKETRDRKKLNKKIEESWNLMTHSKFISDLLKTEISGRSEVDKLGDVGRQLRQGGNLVIIDEVQNVISESGKRYGTLSYMLNLFGHNNRILLLSATPIYDKAFEIGLTLNLLNPRLYFPTTQDEFDGLFIYKSKVKNANLFYQMASGYISYFAGGDPNEFARKRIIKCYHKFGALQQPKYIETLYNDVNVSKKSKKDDKDDKDDREQQVKKGYFIRSKQVSNIFIPKNRQNLMRTLQKKGGLKYLTNFSPKFKFILDEIKRADGKVLVYSEFLSHGVEILAFLLGRYYEYKQVTKVDDLSDPENDGKRYVLWTGKTKNTDKLQKLINMNDNIHGNKIKVIFGSVTIMEGVSFKDIRHVHIVNPWWNETRIDQVIARAIRFRSHSNLSEENRYVNIYKHYSVYQSYPKPFKSFMGELKNNTRGELDNKKIQALGTMLKSYSIDTFLDKVAMRKKKIIRNIELLCKQSAIDCELMKEGNRVSLVEYYIMTTTTESTESIESIYNFIHYYENPSNGLLYTQDDDIYIDNTFQFIADSKPIYPDTLNEVIMERDPQNQNIITLKPADESINNVESGIIPENIECDVSGINIVENYDDNNIVNSMMSRTNKIHILSKIVNNLYNFDGSENKKNKVKLLKCIPKANYSSVEKYIKQSEGDMERTDTLMELIMLIYYKDTPTGEFDEDIPYIFKNIDIPQTFEQDRIQRICNSILYVKSVNDFDNEGLRRMKEFEKLN